MGIIYSWTMFVKVRGEGTGKYLNICSMSDNLLQEHKKVDRYFERHGTTWVECVNNGIIHISKMTIVGDLVQPIRSRNQVNYMNPWNMERGKNKTKRREDDRGKKEATLRAKDWWIKGQKTSHDFPGEWQMAQKPTLEPACNQLRLAEFARWAICFGIVSMRMRWQNWDETRYCGQQVQASKHVTLDDGML